MKIMNYIVCIITLIPCFLSVFLIKNYISNFLTLSKTGYKKQPIKYVIKTKLIYKNLICLPFIIFSMILIALTNKSQSKTKIVICMSVIILILNIMWISFSEKMYVFDKYMININLISGYKKIEFNKIKTVCYFVFPGDSQPQHKVNLKKYIKQNLAYNIGKYNVYLLYDYNENIICALQDVFLQNTDTFNLDLKLNQIPVEKID